jgi:hypothetical protein
MNIIEAEDLVKGLPDQALFQEAQFPSGRIPQFLAVSEVQRRQDMRQRFQAAQQGQQATVKDQILQGGIGSTGMAPEMTSAPPMAPQMPPQGAPMPPPVGMAMGGIVPYRMQEGRTVPGADNELSRLVSLRRAAMARGDSAGAVEIERRIAALNVPGGATVSQSMPNPVLTAPVTAPVSSVNTNPQDLQTRLRNLRERGARPEQIANLERQIAGLSAPPVAPAAAPPSAGQGAVSPGLPAAGAALNAPRQQAGADTSPMGYFANLLKPYERPTEVQAAIDLQRQQMEQGLPPPIDLNQYIQSAQQRQQEARDEARQMAIANTLMNLGTGLFAGDPAAGLQRATQAATETLREGRREAQAEGRMAEQLQLQAAQQNRQNILDTMKFKSEAVGDIANIISGEKKTNRSDQLAAAQILVTYENSLARERAENARQGRTDANSIRAAETSALQQASQYLREHLERTGEEITDQDFATRVRNMANSLNVGGGSSNANRFTVTEAPNKQGG